MVAIVSAGGLGLGTSSLALLGSRGASGSAQFGRASDQVYINAVNGNLVIQNADEQLMGRGLGATALRTYNSQGQFVDDNGDNWLSGSERKAWLVSGDINQAGSVAARLAADGTRTQYEWDVAQGCYIGREGAGAHDRMMMDESANTWIYEDGDTHVKEGYSRSTGQLLWIKDSAGQSLTFTYNGAGWLSSVVTATGETTSYEYSSNNQLSQIRVQLRSVDGGVLDRTLTKVRYGYDALNRLQTVTVDLSPEDNSVTDGRVFVTTYTYDGTSKRVAGITQSDGANLTFGYDSRQRVQSVTDALGGVMRFDYDDAARSTTVTDALGAQSIHRFDSAGRLVSVTAPTVNGVAGVTRYEYNAQGDVTAVTDAESRRVQMDFDAFGNVVRQTDSLGTVVRRAYGVKNQLVAESVATQGEPASNAGATRRVYDAGGERLRFEISAEGRVTEHRYDAYGQRTATLRYAGEMYPIGTAAWDWVPSEGSMASWAAGQDQSRIERTDFAYDWRGQLARQTTYESFNARGEAVGAATTQFVYSASGLLLKTIDAKAGVTQMTYDGMGRLQTTTDALNRVSRMAYDDSGRVVRVTSFDGRLSTTFYDQLGRLVSAAETEAIGASGDWVMSSNVTSRGGTLVKQSGGNDWNAGAYNKNGFVGGISAQFRLLKANSALMVGLNADPQGHGRYQELDWALHVTQDGVLQVWASGSYVKTLGMCSAGDLLALSYQDGKVSFLQNGSLMHEVAVDISVPLYAEAALWQEGASIEDFKVESGSKAPRVVGHGGVVVTDAGAEKKGGTESSWEGGFKSTVGYSGGAQVKFKPAQRDKYLMVGLNTDPGLDKDYRSLDWAWYPAADGILYIYENGSYVGSFGAYSTDETLSVVYDGTSVRYQRNGQTVREVNTTISEPLYLDACFHTRGAKVINLEFSPYAATGQRFEVDGDVVLRGTSATKSLSASNAWFGSVRSAAGVVGDAKLTFKASQVDKYLMMGLNGDPKSDATYSSLDWAIELSSEGTVSVFESGVFAGSFGSYSTEDKFSITYNNKAIQYWRNDELLRTVNTKITGALYMDSSFYSAGAGVEVLAFEAVPQQSPLLVGEEGVSVANGSAEKCAAWPTQWRGAVRSSLGYTGPVSALFRADRTDKNLMVGFNKDPEASSDYQTIDYALQLTSEGTLEIWSSGTRVARVGGYSAGDLLGVTFDGAAVQYWRNGQLLYTLKSEIRDPLYLDSSFYDIGARVSDLVFQRGLPSGSQRSFYDANSQLRMTQDTLGNRQWYFYDAAGRQQATVNALGQMTEFLRDASGLVTSTVSYGKLVNLTALMDATGQPTAVTLDTVRPVSTAGDVRSWSIYDADARLVKSVNALGEVTEYVYDSADRVLLTRRYANTISTQALGSKPTSAMAQPAAHSLDHIERAYYDRDGLQIGVMNAVGALKENQYDAAGRLVLTSQRARSANASQIAAAVSGQGSLAEVRPGEGAGDMKTLNFYNARGQLVGQLDGEGYFSESTFDAVGNVTSTIRYSIKTSGMAVGPALAEVRSAAGGVLQQTSYEYDLVNRVLKQRVDPQGLNLTTTTVYDDGARKLYVTDPAGTTTVQELDAKGRVVASIVDPAGLKVTTKNFYDLGGRLTESVDATGVKTSYEYDALDRKTKQTVNSDGLALVTRWFYGIDGKVAKVVDPAGQTERLIYDALGRLQHRISLATGVESYRYDAFGNLTSKVSRNTQNIDVSESEVGSGLLSMVVSVDSSKSTAANVERYAYDAAGRIVYVVAADGSVLQREYDAVGRVVAETSYAEKIALPGAGSMDGATALYSGSYGSLVGDGFSSVDATQRYTVRVRIRQLVGAGTVYAGVVSKDSSGNLLCATDRMVPCGGTWVYTAARGEPLTPEMGWVTFEGDLNGMAATDVYDYGKFYQGTQTAAPLLLYNYYGKESPGGRVVEVDSLELIEKATGRVISGTDFSAGSGLSQWTGALTGYSFDGGPALSAIDVAARLKSRPDQDRVVRNIYDAAGRVAYRVDAAGGVERFSYDAAGRLIETFAYANKVVLPGAEKSDGSVVSVAGDYAAVLGQDWAKLDMSRTYKVRVRMRQISGKGAFYLGVVTRDKAGNLLYSTEGMKNSGGTWLYTRDSGQMITPEMGWCDFEGVIGGEAARDVYDYGKFFYGSDSARPLLFCNFYQNNADGNRVVDVDRLELIDMSTGELVSGSSMDGLSTNICFWGGEQVGWFNSNSRAISEYQLLKRLREGADQGRAVRYVYDAAGRRTHEVSAEGSVTQFQYDAAGRVVSSKRLANQVPTGQGLELFYRQGTNSSASRFLGSFKAGDVVTATVRFKAKAGVTGGLFLGDAGGADAYDNAKFTGAVAGDDGWQTMTLTHKMTHDDVLWVFVYGNRDGTNPNEAQSVLYDNVRVTSVMSGLVMQEDFNQVTWAGGAYQDTKSWNVSGYAQLVPSMGSTLQRAGAGLDAFLKTLSDPVNDRETRYVYDAAGRRVFEVDPSGVVTKSTYDQAGRVVSSCVLANRLPAEGAFKLFNNDGRWRGIHNNGLGKFKAGDVVTATVRFLAPKSLRGDIFIGDIGGADPYDNAVWGYAHGTGSWQTLTVRVTMKHDDDLSVCLYNQTALDGGVVIYDDLRVSSLRRGDVFLESFDEGGKSGLVNRGWGFDGESESTTVDGASFISSPSFQEFLESLIDPVRDQVTRYAYDSLGRKVFEVDAGGGVTEFRYNSAGQLASTVKYASSIGLPEQGTGDGATLSVSGAYGLLAASSHSPIDTSKVYQVRARMRQLSGTGTVYVGAISSDAGGAIQGNPYQGTYQYCAASGVTLSPEMGWQVFEGLITGEVPPVAGASYNKFFAGAKSASPLLLYNYYGNGAAGDPSRTLEVDYLELVDVATGQVINANAGMESGRSGWAAEANAYGAKGVQPLTEQQIRQRLHVSGGDQLTRHVYNPAGQLVYTRFAANAAIGNIVTQTIGVQLGLQERFEWKAVRAAALNSAVSSRLNDYLELSAKGGGKLENISRQVLNGLVGQTSQMLMGVRGRLDVMSIVADSFGNALADVIRVNSSKVIGAAVTPAVSPMHASVSEVNKAGGGAVQVGNSALQLVEVTAEAGGRLVTSASREVPATTAGSVVGVSVCNENARSSAPGTTLVNQDEEREDEETKNFGDAVMWDAVRAGATATEASQKRWDAIRGRKMEWIGFVEALSNKRPSEMPLFFNLPVALDESLKNSAREAHVNHANNLLKVASDAFDSEVGPPEVKTKAWLEAILKFDVDRNRYVEWGRSIYANSYGSLFSNEFKEGSGSAYKPRWGEGICLSSVGQVTFKIEDHSHSGGGIESPLPSWSDVAITASGWKERRTYVAATTEGRSYLIVPTIDTLGVSAETMRSLTNDAYNTSVNDELKSEYFKGLEQEYRRNDSKLGILRADEHNFLSQRILSRELKSVLRMEGTFVTTVGPLYGQLGVVIYRCVDGRCVKL